mmetsp:Transcript_13938/g.17178  ORF Transcript_13938/g.17178 Transcript_13938/m.17178 type:complete len:161 (-) Transcript_13938:514-996(-)
MSALMKSFALKQTKLFQSQLFLQKSFFCIQAGQKCTGVCKWFSSEKGFGFITVDDSEQEAFVHQSNIHAPGFRSLAEGEKVEFEVEMDTRGRPKAINVTGPDGSYVQGAPRNDFGGGSNDSFASNFGGGAMGAAGGAAAASSFGKSSTFGSNDDDDDNML